MNKKLLGLYGLKFNPFSPDIPVEALQMTPRIDSFCWRVEQLAGEGGFAVVTGAPGVGKSVTMRVLAERLSGLRDVQVGVLSRPQAGMADFYREMGELFGVELHPLRIPLKKANDSKSSWTAPGSRRRLPPILAACPR